MYVEKKINISFFFLFQLNIHKFKCVARFGLMHIAATNLCVWLRTVVKECTKEIAQYRVDRGHGVSEDYMILGKALSVLKFNLTFHVD